MTAPLPVDRRYLSRYAAEVVGFTAMVSGVANDVDGDDVAVRVLDVTTSPPTLLRNAVAERIEQGRYGVLLSGADTATANALLDLEFSFEVGGRPGAYVVELQVGDSAPAYDRLSPLWKEVVESVWTRFADLFDSPLGGPNLQVYAQTRFGRQRLAQLVTVALGRLNTISAPHHTYSVDDGDDGFPFRQWGPLVQQALYVEVIKHLIRSYVEQPEVVLASAVSRLDRRDYMQRWESVLAMEKEDLDIQLANFRVNNLGLGGVRVMVSGGAFGRGRNSVAGGGLGQAAARGYFPRAFVG